MIELTLLHYIENTISDVAVFMEEPERPPTTYIIVQKTGGGIENEIREATFAVMSYGASLYDAAALNERVVNAVRQMCPTDGVFSAVLNSDYEYTNTTTKQYRYQAVFEIYY